MPSVYQELVTAVRTPQTHRKRPPFYTAAPNHSPMSQSCGGKIHSGSRARCPAFNLPCNSCGKLGHFAKVCCSRHLQPEPCQTIPTTSSNKLSIGTDPLISNVNYIVGTDPVPKIPIHIICLCLTRLRHWHLSCWIHFLNEHVDNLFPSSVIRKLSMELRCIQ